MGKINYFLSLLSATPYAWHLPFSGFYASRTLDVGTIVTPLWESKKQRQVSRNLGSTNHMGMLSCIT